MYPAPIQTLGLPYGFFFFNENLEQILKRLVSCLAPQLCPHHFIQILKSYEKLYLFPKSSDSKA